MEKDKNKINDDISCEEVVRELKKVFPYLSQNEIESIDEFLDTQINQKAYYILDYAEFKKFLKTNNFDSSDLKNMFYSYYFDLVPNNIRGLDINKFELILNKTLEVDPTFTNGKILYLKYINGNNSLSYTDYQNLFKYAENTLNKYTFSNGISEENNSKKYEKVRYDLFEPIFNSIFLLQMKNFIQKTRKVLVKECLNCFLNTLIPSIVKKFLLML